MIAESIRLDNKVGKRKDIKNSLKVLACAVGTMKPPLTEVEPFLFVGVGGRQAAGAVLLTCSVSMSIRPPGC